VVDVSVLSGTHVTWTYLPRISFLSFFFYQYTSTSGSSLSSIFDASAVFWVVLLKNIHAPISNEVTHCINEEVLYDSFYSKIIYFLSCMSIRCTHMCLSKSAPLLISYQGVGQRSSLVWGPIRAAPCRIDNYHITQVSMFAYPKYVYKFYIGKTRIMTS
jgi:hypothetical protein